MLLTSVRYWWLVRVTLVVALRYILEGMTYVCASHSQTRVTWSVTTKLVLYLDLRFWIVRYSTFYNKSRPVCVISPIYHNNAYSPFWQINRADIHTSSIWSMLAFVLLSTLKKFSYEITELEKLFLQPSKCKIHWCHRKWNNISCCYWFCICAQNNPFTQERNVLKTQTSVSWEKWSSSHNSVATKLKISCSSELLTRLFKTNARDKTAPFEIFRMITYRIKCYLDISAF